MKAEIVLKSGVIITADVESLSVRRNGVGEMNGLAWTDLPVENSDGEQPLTRRLQAVNIDEVAAVITEGRFKVADHES